MAAAVGMPMRIISLMVIKSDMSGTARRLPPNEVIPVRNPDKSQINMNKVKNMISIVISHPCTFDHKKAGWKPAGLRTWCLNQNFICSPSKGI